MKVRIQVCRGMMCSSNGGGRPLERVFEEELTARGVMDVVELFSPGCMGSCGEGPCVRINGQKFFHVNPPDVSRLVEEEVLPLIGAE